MLSTMRKYFNRFTNGGGGGILGGLGIWLTQGGINRPIPTPIWYWVGVGLMSVGAVVLIYGWRYGNRLVKEENEKLLDDIKASLINMNVIERDTATEMSSKIEIEKETAIKVLRDCGKVIDHCLSKINSIPPNKQYDTLAIYSEAVGRILDMNNVGLKSALADNELYKASKLELEKKRLSLKPVRRYKLTQWNIIRIEKLSYGVNSYIILRGMLEKFEAYTKGTPLEVRISLHGIEKVSAAILKAMLEKLEGDWSEEKRK